MAIQEKSETFPNIKLFRFTHNNDFTGLPRRVAPRNDDSEKVRIFLISILDSY